MAKRKKQTAASEDSEFDSRLRDYSVVARVSAAADKLHGRMGNWPVYAAAAGSALAMATSASASIISLPYSSSTVTAPGIGHSSNRDGSFGLGPDYLLIIRAASLAQSSVALSVNGGPQSAVHIFEAPGSSALARNFALSSKIGASGGPGAFTAKIVQAHESGADFGNFVSGVPGFAGFSVQTANGRDYGWIELTFTELNGLPYELTADAFGLETNGQPIEAGEIADGTTTPEPGSMALAFLATGAAGVVALRRRRLAAASALPTS